jgi:uncharacterized protein with HEPN domain
MNRVLNMQPDIKLSNSRKIVDNGYDTVSDEIIWSTTITHLPSLKGEIEILLKELYRLVYKLNIYFKLSVIIIKGFLDAPV